MKSLAVCLISLLVSFSVAPAEQPTVLGQVRLAGGQSVAEAQVMLFDLGDLRRSAVTVTTDAAGQFALPLAALGRSAQSAHFALGQSYPNPFNPSTIIPYKLTAPAQVRLDVFNLLGQLVATLVDAQQGIGSYQAQWDGTDVAGQAVAAGVYLYRLTVHGVQQTGRMVLVDGQAGVPTSGGVALRPVAEGREVTYGLVVSRAGMIAYVDADFRVETGMEAVVIEVETQGLAKAVQGNEGILGDVDNDGQVNLIDALLVAMYIANPASVLPNGGNIAFGDVNRDGVIDLTDAWFIATYSYDPTAVGLPVGVGEPATSGPPATGGTGGIEQTFLLPGGVEMEFVKIERGVFQMGSPDTEEGHSDNEGPVHEVEISRSFWLGKYEITQGQWETVMGEAPWSGSSYAQSDSSHPAVRISWDDVQAFIKRLNDAVGEEIYRLPSEAEWEYACRAGSRTRWSFGDDESQLTDYAWYRANAWNVGEKYAHAVGGKRPNPWGLYDMHGNVREWVQDWRGAYPSTRQVDPQGPSSGSFRVIRGGDFHSYALGLRSAARYPNPPGTGSSQVGARLLRIDNP